MPENIPAAANITDISDLKAALAQMTKACPKCWKAVSARRYLVPHYRSADYFNQEYLDQMFAFFFWAYLGGDFGAKPDPVIRTVYMNQVMAMQEKRPIYFLESELAERLMLTPLPLDLVPNELRWIRREFRVMLPRDLLTIERHGVRQSIMFLDIGHARANKYLMLDEAMEREVKLFTRLQRLARGKELPLQDVRPVFSQNGICISGQLTQEEKEVPGVHYGIIRPFEDLSIGELIKVGKDFETSTPCDTTDDALMSQMQHLAIIILLFLGLQPLEYDAQEREPAEIRKLRVINERVIPSLVPAKFIGKELYRAKYRPRESLHAGLGGTKAAHFVKGAWKWQHYGSKSSLRKRIWIEPYATGELRLTT